MTNGRVDPITGVAMPVLVNNSNKTLVGYGIQPDVPGLKGRATMGFNSLVGGYGLEPGKSQELPGFQALQVAVPDAPQATGWIKSFTIFGALFSDGAFYGPEDLLQDFTKRIESIRSMARDVQYIPDQKATLEWHRDALNNALKNPAMLNASVDGMALRHRSDMAAIMLRIWEQQMSKPRRMP